MPFKLIAISEVSSPLINNSVINLGIQGSPPSRVANLSENIGTFYAGTKIGTCLLLENGDILTNLHMIFNIKNYAKQSKPGLTKEPGWVSHCFFPKESLLVELVVGSRLFQFPIESYVAHGLPALQESSMCSPGFDYAILRPAGSILENTGLVGVSIEDLSRAPRTTHLVSRPFQNQDGAFYRLSSGSTSSRSLSALGQQFGSIGEVHAHSLRPTFSGLVSFDETGRPYGMINHNGQNTLLSDIKRNIDWFKTRLGEIGETPGLVKDQIHEMLFHLMNQSQITFYNEDENELMAIKKNFDAYLQKANTIFGASTNRLALFIGFRKGVYLSRVGGHDKDRNREGGTQDGAGKSADDHGINQGKQWIRYRNTVLNGLSENQKLSHKTLLDKIDAVSEKIEEKKAKKATGMRHTPQEVAASQKQKEEQKKLKAEQKHAAWLEKQASKPT